MRGKAADQGVIPLASPETGLDAGTTRFHVPALRWAMRAGRVHRSLASASPRDRCLNRLRTAGVLCWENLMLKLSYLGGAAALL